MTREAIDALRWYATQGAAGVAPTYPVLRALLARGYVTLAGAITEQGRDKLNDAEKAGQ